VAYVILSVSEESFVLTCKILRLRYALLRMTAPVTGEVIHTQYQCSRAPVRNLRFR